MQSKQFSAPMQQIHASFLERALPILREDSRILGVARTTSSEPYTPLSLTVISGFPLQEEREKIAENLGPCLVSFKEDQQLVCLYGDPLLRVELSFVPIGEFSGQSEVLWEREQGSLRGLAEGEHRHVDLQWMEDRFWAWVHDGALCLARGEIFALIDLLGLLRRQVLGPLIAAKHGLAPRGVAGIERVGGEDLRALQATVAIYESRSAEISLKEAARLYVDLRETLAPATLRRHPRTEMSAMRFLHEVSDRVGEKSPNLHLL